MAKKTTRKKTSKRAPRRVEAPAPEISLARPIGLDDIVGQELGIGVLRGAIASGRVHHAWIFQGPPGVGKFTTALAFSALLLDPTTRPNMAGVFEPDPDGPAQRLLRAGTHPDLHVVTKELARFSDDADIRSRKLTNIPVDVLRTRMLEPAALAPTVTYGALASKVFIVDEAELIDPVGQNALLKTLEEPARATVLILITSQPERLLPTIRSRCQRVAFTSLSDDQMRLWIDRASSRADSKLRDLGVAERQTLLAIADGSPGVAELAVATGMIGWPALLEPRLVAADAGRPVPDLGMVMADLVNNWATGWVDTHDGASKEAANHAAAGHLFRLLGVRYRRSLAGADPGRASRAIEAIALTEATIRANVQAQFAFEDLAARLAMAGE